MEDKRIHEMIEDINEKIKNEGNLSDSDLYDILYQVHIETSEPLETEIRKNKNDDEIMFKYLISKGYLVLPDKGIDYNDVSKFETEEIKKDKAKNLLNYSLSLIPF